MDTYKKPKIERIEISIKDILTVSPPQDGVEQGD